MASDWEVWWNIIGTYPPMKPYLEYANITQSNLIHIWNGWRNQVAREPSLEAVLGGNPDLLDRSKALEWFRMQYPQANPDYEPTESTLPSIYGGQYVPDSEPVTVEPITPVTTVQTQEEHIVTISATTNQIINDITAGILQAPDWFHNNIDWVKNGQLNENDFLTSFHNLVNQNIIHEAMAEPEPEPEPEWSGWVTKPSGIIEYMTMKISTKQTLEGQGWVFTADKPVTPQPENENISIVFYTGTGGDLKTHFNINSIIVTPEEKEELAGWLYQNYGTSILLVVNRLTNDIRTHTAQQVKAYVLQKIQDDTPQEVLPTPTTPTTPPTVPPTITGKSGIMGAGVAGAIALLILGGFIIDSRKK